MSESAASTVMDRRSINVGIVQRLDVPGGVQSVALSLIKGLNSINIVPDILWDIPPKQSLLESRGLAAGYRPIHLTIPTRVVERMPISVRHMLRMFNVVYSSKLAQRYDFFYIFYNGFIVNDATPHIRYLSGPPLLPQLEQYKPGLAHLPIRTFRWAYRKWLYEKYPVYSFHRDSNYVINSQFTAQLFEEAHNVRLPVIHPPINLAGRSFSPDDLYRRDTVTFFSRFARYKRPEMVIKLAERYPNQRFLLMGGVQVNTRNYYESLIALVRQGGLNNVEFLDNPPDSRVREELARTRFFVFPTVNEHFGMATAEAIGSGAVPFVHDSGGQREIVPEPRLRFQDEEFYEKFSSIYSAPDDELNAMRIRLLENVQRFSEDAFNEKVLAFLDQHIEREVFNELQASTA